MGIDTWTFDKWIWTHGHGHMDTVTWTWTHRHDHMAVNTWKWTHGNEHADMNTWIGTLNYFSTFSVVLWFVLMLNHIRTNSLRNAII